MRLAVLVSQLDAENAIAPAGALCMLSTGAVKENAAYAGARRRCQPAPQRGRRAVAKPRAQPPSTPLLPTPCPPRPGANFASPHAPLRPPPARPRDRRAGLPSASAGSIGSYVFANQLKPKNVLQPALTNSLDFLTPADSIVPKGALCAHLDESTGVTTIRNLVWPGFVAFSTPSKKWGYCYFGTGEKNADIAFMLP